MTNNHLSPIKEIIKDAKKGKMFILVDDKNRENEGDLIIPGSKCNSKSINFMAKHGRGLICLALTKKQVDILKLHQYKNEIAYLAKFKPYSEVKLPFKKNGGEEILILSGELCDSLDNFSAVTWIRDPKSCFQRASAGAHGACIVVKSGHLY